MARAVLSVFLLTVVYGLVLGSFHPWDLVLGIVVSSALYLATRGYLFGGETRIEGRLFSRMVGFIPFSLAVIWDITVGTWEVALVTLHIRPLHHPGIVTIPIGERSPVGVAATALVMTLSPGEFLVDVDRKENKILMHVLDASDPEAIRRKHEEFYQRYQRRVFP